MHTLVGQTEGKTPLTRSTRRWECNIKSNVKEKVCNAVDSGGLFL